MEEPVTGNLCAVFHKAENEHVRGRIHSVFDNVINIALFLHDGEKRIVTLVPPGFPRLPDSVVISKNCFRKIVNLSNSYIIEVEKSKNVIAFGETGLKLVLKDDKAAVDVREPDGANAYMLDTDKVAAFLWEYEKFIEKRGKKDAVSDLPGVYKDTLKRFVNGFFLNDGKKIMSSFQKLAGAGKGLTPSCDDAMVGAMSLLYPLYLLGRISGHAKQYFQNAGLIKKALLEEEITTDISCKYLKCACEGYFSEPLQRISDWIFTGVNGELEDLFKPMATIGHSSGLDMLVGMEAVAEALI